MVYKIVSGRMVEKIKAWKRGSAPSVRRRRIKGSSTLKKLEANLRAAVRHLARIISSNFSRRDLLVTLSYDEEHLPKTWQAQEKSAADFLRRLGRARVKAGIREPMKWISVCSERDGDTEEPVRRHVHMVITGAGIEHRDGHWWVGERTLDDIWGLGLVDGVPLRDQADYTALAIYLLRQAGREADRKKWHSSRNMAKPVITEEIARTGREPRIPRGGKVMERQYDAEAGRSYIRYVAPERNGGQDALPGNIASACSSGGRPPIEGKALRDEKC